MTPEQIDEILTTHTPGSELARKFDIATSTISKIRTRRGWTRPRQVGPFPEIGAPRPYNRLTEEQAKEIIASREPGRRLARRWGVSEGAVSAVRYGRTWKHLPRP